MNQKEMHMEDKDNDKKNAVDRGWIREARPGRGPDGGDVMLVMEDGSIAWMRASFMDHAWTIPASPSEE